MQFINNNTLIYDNYTLNELSHCHKLLAHLPEFYDFYVQYSIELEYTTRYIIYFDINKNLKTL